MVDFYAQRQLLDKLEGEIKTLRDAFDVDGCKAELASLTEQSHAENFWQDVENAQKVNRRMNVCAKKIKQVEDVEKKLAETRELLDVIEEMDEEAEVPSAVEEVDAFATRVSDLAVMAQ